MNQTIYWLSHRFFSAFQAITFIESYLKEKQIDVKAFRASVRGYQTDGECYLKELMLHKLAETPEKDIPI